MTLTELRYITTLAEECHFGRAAERCFVSQPTLSVAVKKLEEELGTSVDVIPVRSDDRFSQYVAQRGRVVYEAD